MEIDSIIVMKKNMRKAAEYNRLLTKRPQNLVLNLFFIFPIIENGNGFSVEGNFYGCTY